MKELHLAHEVVIENPVVVPAADSEGVIGQGRPSVESPKGGFKPFPDGIQVVTYDRTLVAIQRLALRVAQHELQPRVAFAYKVEVDERAALKVLELEHRRRLAAGDELSALDANMKGDLAWQDAAGETAKMIKNVKCKEWKTHPSISAQPHHKPKRKLRPRTCPSLPDVPLGFFSLPQSDILSSVLFPSSTPSPATFPSWTHTSPKKSS